jgi:hypothetical protein
MLSRSHKLRLERLEKARRQKSDAKRKRSSPDDPWVKQAVGDTFLWVTQHTRTYDEHWHEEGRPSRRMAV